MLRPALLATLLLASPFPGGAQEPAASRAPFEGDGVRVPAGSFVPAFADVADDGSVAPRRVEAFELDARPVTVGEYLAFLRTHAQWRRSATPAVLAGDAYLESWDDDLVPDAAPDRPVTEVTWFAARAFCAARGGRLPTTDEWEYAAALDGLRSDGTRDPAFLARLRRIYAVRPAPDALPPVGRTFRQGPGLWDLHGVVYEWTADFNNTMTTGAGRDDQGLDRQLFCAAGSTDATDRADYAAFTRYAFRTGLTGSYAGMALGFRCARTP